MSPISDNAKDYLIDMGFNMTSDDFQQNGDPIKKEAETSTDKKEYYRSLGQKKEAGEKPLEKDAGVFQTVLEQGKKAPSEAYLNLKALGKKVLEGLRNAGNFVKENPKETAGSAAVGFIAGKATNSNKDEK